MTYMSPNIMVKTSASEGSVAMIVVPDGIPLETKTPQEFTRWMYKLMEPMLSSRSR